jgi:plastocyanin
VTVAVACAAALLTPAAAGASVTKNVYAGGPGGSLIGKIAAKLGLATKLKPLNPGINAFFNQRTTINVGDRVSFQFNGFHTVDIPAKGGSDLSLIVPGATVPSSVTDAAGTPFWFDGKVPAVGLNPLLLGASKKLVYTGASRVDSGLPLGKPKPFNVTFSKPGVYKFYCDVHVGMIGYVVVKAKGASIPTAKQDAAALTAQATSDVIGAGKLLKVKPAANTVSLGKSTSSGVELYAMFPASLTVKAGTVVTFAMSKYTREDHTASFGPSAYRTTLANSFNGANFSPIATYPSDPTQPLTLSTSSHGNGFASTGILDQDPTTKAILPSSKIDFTTSGTYHFQCLIHPFMQGTIIVN